MIEVSFFLSLKFSVLRCFGNKPFSAEALFKCSKYSFFFAFDFSVLGSSPLLGIWSTPPMQYFEGKNMSCFTQPSRCLWKKCKKKQSFFYRDESISSQEEMWKTILNLLTTATKISWQCELTDAFLQVEWAGFKATRQWEWLAHPSSRANISRL